MLTLKELESVSKLDAVIRANRTLLTVIEDIIIDDGINITDANDDNVHPIIFLSYVNSPYLDENDTIFTLSNYKGTITLKSGGVIDVVTSNYKFTMLARHLDTMIDIYRSL